MSDRGQALLEGSVWRTLPPAKGRRLGPARLGLRRYGKLGEQQFP